MDDNTKNQVIQEVKENAEQRQQYLNKIPILNSINNINSQQDMEPVAFQNPSSRLAVCLENLLKDCLVYQCNFRAFSYDNKKGFFAFYDGVNEWLEFKCGNKQSYNNKQTEFKLNKPYRLAIELFQAYIKFRKEAKYARYKNGRSGAEYQPNIRDLFTDEDLIQLGGDAFIRDCLEAVGVPLKDIEKQYIGPQNNFFPILSELDDANDTNPINRQNKSVVRTEPLIRVVDNHMSWSIFKSHDSNLQLRDDEIEIFNKAELQESFWKKHLWLGELKTLPFTGTVALLLGLVGGFVFGITGGPLALLILTPIGAGAVFIAPSVGRTNRIAAITDNMQKQSNENAEFNTKLRRGEEEYKQYKDSNPDFLTGLKPKPNKGEDIEGIKEGDNIINTDSKKESKIIPKENQSKEQIHPLNMVNTTKQNQNEQDNKDKEKEKTESEPPQ